MPGEGRGLGRAKRAAARVLDGSGDFEPGIGSGSHPHRSWADWRLMPAGGPGRCLPTMPGGVGGSYRVIEGGAAGWSTATAAAPRSRRAGRRTAGASSTRRGRGRPRLRGGSSTGGGGRGSTRKSRPPALAGVTDERPHQGAGDRAFWPPVSRSPHEHRTAPAPGVLPRVPTGVSLPSRTLGCHQPPQPGLCDGGTRSPGAGRRGLGDLDRLERRRLVLVAVTPSSTPTVDLAGLDVTRAGCVR